LAIVSGRIWTYQNAAMKPTGNTMRTTHEMMLANPSIMSGGKKEAFARFGASNVTIAAGITVVFFMVLLKKSAKWGL
jgi:hypothetical protein